MEIILGNCLEVMKGMESNSISCIVTDPPYGLKFMGKDWDKGVPGIPYWSECFRVCKPGSFMLAFGGTRTFHRLVCAIEDSGWEIRDCVSWIYGQGFPKSHNHFGIEGYGTALKPAWEPIIMAMKTCEGTFKQNAEKWGQAGINIDGCRIGSDDTRNYSSYAMTSKNIQGGGFGSSSMSYENKITSGSECGRWPANLILNEEAGQMLDEQSGVSRSLGGRSGNNNAFSGGFCAKHYGDLKPGLGDQGGASRFFYCAKASIAERNKGCEGLPEYISECSLSSKGGLRKPNNEFKTKNNHPTVKPLKLMEYLIKLIMPPKDAILLDPFAGSGTTILAAKNLGINAIGIEINPEYIEIANKRLVV